MRRPSPGLWTQLRPHLVSDPRAQLGLALLVVVLLVLLLSATRQRRARGVRLDVGGRARMALAAPYFEIHHFRSGDLAGLSAVDRRRLRWVLRKDWEIVDAATAQAEVEHLERSGHRGDPRFRDRRRSAMEQQRVDRALLAWDAMRLVFLARCCFALGYLDAVATWRAIDAAAALARSGFASWAEWGDAFLEGRVLWGASPDSYHRVLVRRYLSAPRSPWTRVAWRDAVRPR